MSRRSNLDALFGPSRRRSRPRARTRLQMQTRRRRRRSLHLQTPLPAAGAPRSGAIGAMSNTLRGLAAKADAAAILEQGAAVIDLDPSLIDASFIADRVADANDVGLGSLVESIRESGQQVPVLVRPHPTASGRYQIAFGRRRTRAAQVLERPVRAIVRRSRMPNSSSRRARRTWSGGTSATSSARSSPAPGGARLPARDDHRRDGRGKGDLSTLISVARSVPEDVLTAIGPARPPDGRAGCCWPSASRVPSAPRSRA